jgi:hypothetical protein
VVAIGRQVFAEGISAANGGSITSSARPSSVIGKVRPSAFAALITISYLVGACTGRSAQCLISGMRPF